MLVGNLEVYGVIYKITNKLNSKSYIGQTINGFNIRYEAGGKDIERVYRHYKFLKETNRFYNEHLLNSIIKYGFEAFDVIHVLDVAFSKEELDIKEKVYIDVYNCILNGYNHKHGGANGKPSKNTRMKMSENNKGINNPNYGKAHSDETKKLMRDNHWSKKGLMPVALKRKGKDNPNYGKIRSEETKLKISEGNKGKVFSEETRKKISNSRIGDKNPIAVKVICITTNEIFGSAKQGSDKYNCDASYIIKCCRKKAKTCGKLEDGTRLEWMYYEEYLKLNNKDKEAV